jgi:response regulator of citrate/malate metabolism
MLNKKILLIEDDEKKIEDIRAFILDNYPSAELTIKESYQSGLRQIMYHSYDLLLLDMSLPTWERDLESVGSFEKFGGFKIMKEMVRKQVSMNTILITMFDDFGESDSSLTLGEIDGILRKEFEKFYKGYIFYNSRESNWKNVLSDKLNAIGIK